MGTEADSSPGTELESGMRVRHSIPTEERELNVFYVSQGKETISQVRSEAVTVLPPALK